MLFLHLDGSINYNEIAEKLCKYNYKGTITLETSPKQGQPVDYMKMSAEEFYKRAYDAADRLRNMVDDLNKKRI